MYEDGESTWGNPQTAISAPLPTIKSRSFHAPWCKDTQVLQPVLNMQIAEILSDLTSLRVCVSVIDRLCHRSLLNPPKEHDAALTLVTSYKSLDKSSTIGVAGSQGQLQSTDDPISSADSARSESSLAFQGEDPDLQRVIDLVDLHYGLKEKHVQGMDTGLQKARIDVNRVLERLKAGDNGTTPKR